MTITQLTLLGPGPFTHIRLILNQITFLETFFVCLMEMDQYNNFIFILQPIERLRTLITKSNELLDWKFYIFALSLATIFILSFHLCLKYLEIDIIFLWHAGLHRAKLIMCQLSFQKSKKVLKTSKMIHFSINLQPVFASASFMPFLNSKSDSSFDISIRKEFKWGVTSLSLKHFLIFRFLGLGRTLKQVVGWPKCHFHPLKWQFFCFIHYLAHFDQHDSIG